jgi:hypothetical protein
VCTQWHRAAALKDSKQTPISTCFGMIGHLHTCGWAMHTRHTHTLRHLMTGGKRLCIESDFGRQPSEESRKRKLHRAPTQVDHTYLIGITILHMISHMRPRYSTELHLRGFGRLPLSEEPQLHCKSGGALQLRNYLSPEPTRDHSPQHGPRIKVASFEIAGPAPSTVFLCPARVTPMPLLCD